jgi:hypothetical protein
MISEPTDTIDLRRITAFGGQHKKCFAGTRLDVLEEIRLWVQARETTTPVYSIRDVAGTGKSTIARTLVDEWPRSSRFAFFFSQEADSVSNASELCFFIKNQVEAYCSNPRLDEYWGALSSAALQLLRSESIEQQWKQLVYEPFSRITPDRIYVLVIDALDECTVDTRGTLLKCILDMHSSGSMPHVRTLLTTRNEEDIRVILDRDDYRDIIISKTLLYAENTNTDVAVYVNHLLDERRLFISSIEQRQLLINRCGGLFLFASLSCKLLEDAGTEDGPLDEILQSFASLDSLYHQVLRRADRKAEYTREALKRILGIILVALEPLSVVSISHLLSIPVERVEDIVGRLGSVLSIGPVDQPVSILHATFAEFLVRQTWMTAQKERATNEYAISRPQSNRLMAHCCLSILLKELKDNMGDLPSYPADGNDRSMRRPDSDELREILQQKTTSALRYAALAWISHTIPALHDQSLVNSVRKVFQLKILNWLELGSISVRLPEYMSDIHRLQQKIDGVLGLSASTVVSTI